MTREECIGLLKRYAEYDGMGIPNLAGCKEAMRMAAELLEGPSLPSNLDEAAEISDLEANNLADDYIKFLAAGLTKNEPHPIGPRWMKKLASDRFKAGADFGAKNMLAKLRENCVIIVKDLYEIAMEGKFIEGREEGREEGKKWMAEQFQKIEGELVDWYETKGVDYCCGIKTEDAFEVPEGFYIKKK